MVEIDTIMTALASGGISASIARLFISKSLADLEKVSDKIHDIGEQLSAIKEKLANNEKTYDMVFEHDRKIASLETKLSTSFRQKVGGTS